MAVSGYSDCSMLTQFMPETTNWSVKIILANRNIEEFYLIHISSNIEETGTGNAVRIFSEFVIMYWLGVPFLLALFV